MRAACPVATFARQGLHCSGARPAAWRSWLIKPHWPVPTATCAGAAGTGAGFGLAVACGTRAATTWGCADGAGLKRATCRGSRSDSGSEINEIVVNAVDCANNACSGAAECGGASCPMATTASRITPPNAPRDRSGLISADTGRIPKFIYDWRGVSPGGDYNIGPSIRAAPGSLGSDTAAGSHPARLGTV